MSCVENIHTSYPTHRTRCLITLAEGKKLNLVAKIYPTSKALQSSVLIGILVYKINLNYPLGILGNSAALIEAMCTIRTNIRSLNSIVWEKEME